MMNDLLTMTGNIFLLLGAFFALTGAVGLVRFPEFFARLHAAGVLDSLGMPFILLGVALHMGISLAALKILLLLLFLLIVTPTACHALAKAAFIADKTREHELSRLTSRDVPKINKAKIQERKK